MIAREGLRGDDDVFFVRSTGSNVVLVRSFVGSIVRYLFDPLVGGRVGGGIYRPYCCVPRYTSKSRNRVRWSTKVKYVANP